MLKACGVRMSSEQPGFGYGRPQYASSPYNSPPSGPMQPGPMQPGPIQPNPYEPQMQPPAGWQPGGPPQLSYPAQPSQDANRRPVAVTLSCLLTVTASLQAVCAIAMVWLFIAAGAGSLDPTDPTEGPLFHILERANLALTNGLAAPLLGFPAASLIAGFLLLNRANWSRILNTVLGVAASVWMIIWKLDQPTLVAVPITYIAFCVLLLWLPGSNHWYRRSTPTRP